MTNKIINIIRNIQDILVNDKQVSCSRTTLFREVVSPHRGHQYVGTPLRFTRNQSTLHWNS